MDQTQIQPSKAGRTLLGHSSDPPPVEISERAPTLMAGVTAGSQGLVRVWAPSRLRVWLVDAAAAGISIGLLLGGYMAVMHHLALMPSAAFYLFGGYCLGGVWETIRRPIYLTTDDSGIGITTRSGSRALRWSEIKSLERDPGSDVLCLRAPDKVTISLFGHSKASQDDLVALVADKASLEQRPALPGSPPHTVYFYRIPALSHETIVSGSSRSLKGTARPQLEAPKAGSHEIAAPEEETSARPALPPGPRPRRVTGICLLPPDLSEAD